MKLTAEMIREAEAHLPSSRNKLPPDRWAWMADFLNAALSDPGKICPCCRTTRDGEIMDHLPAPIPPSVPDGIEWDKFPGWLIDHNEGDEITEELLQHALAAMIAAAPKPGDTP